MKNLKRLVAILLTVVLLTVLCACDSEPGGQEGETSAPLSDAEGVREGGRISEASLPQDATLQDWYEMAKGREQLTNAIYYAQDAQGVWHCWLYVGAQLEGAALTFGVQQDAGEEILHLNCNGALLADTGSVGAYYFTYQTEDEPNFELYVNGEFEGMLETQGSVAVTH